MYIGSQNLMKKYDQCLLQKGYSMIELVDKASDCLMKHMHYKRIVIICGPGNNGADGLSLALKLKESQKDVHVYCFENQNLSDASDYYLDLCYEKNVELTFINDQTMEDMVLNMQQAEAIVDAIFGFGLKSSPKGMYQIVIEQINQLYEQEIIAVDIPTGLDCNTGAPYPSVVCATKTITLSALKNGFLHPDSAFFTGEVIVETLDVCDIYDEVGLYQVADKELVKPILKKRKYDGYKGTYGYVGIVAGSFDYKGAALLCGKACVYSGCGITTLITCQEVIDSLTHYCPEITTCLRPSLFSKEDFEKYHALLIGCGLGLDIDAYRYVDDILTLTSQPLVIDADALTILASQLDVLQTQSREIILTPHMGEFKRLCSFDEHDDILSVACHFARQHKVTLVLKGPKTIVTDGHESYRVFAGNEAMAVGGMGDVLAGMIVSLLGQGYKAIDAALLGVYLHGYSADQEADEAYTIIPSRLIERIPLSMKEMQKK